jgi:hypothetical protein
MMACAKRACSPGQLDMTRSVMGLRFSRETRVQMCWMTWRAMSRNEGPNVLDDLAGDICPALPA